MKPFLAVLRLELSGWKAAFSLNAGTKRKKENKLPRILMMGMMLLIVAVYMVFIEWNAMDFLLAIGAEDMLLKLLVSISMLMTLVLGVFQVMSALYFSKDMAILSYLPVKERQMYAARLLAQWIEESLISALLIVPGTIVYMIRTSFSAGLLARCIAVTVLTTAVPVCFSALVAFCLAQLSSFWRHRDTVTTVLSTLFIVVYIGMSYFMGQMGGRAADDEGVSSLILAIRPALEGLTDRLPPVRFAANALAYGGKDLLWTLLVSAGALIFVILLCGRGYIRCACRGLENSTSGKKVKLGETRFRQDPPLRALIRREISEMVRTPAYFTNGVLITLIMPALMVGLMLFSFSTTVDGGIGGMLEILQGDGTPMIIIAAFLTAMMGLLLGMNSSAATAVSREGSRHGLFMSLPVDAKTIIRSKLYMGLTFSWAGLPLPCILCAVLIPGFLPYAFLCFLWAALLGYFGTCTGLAIDISRPKMDWINETQAVKQNYNQLFSLLLYMVLLGIIAGGSVAVLLNGMDPKLYAVLLTVLLFVFAALARLWLAKKTAVYAAIEA